MGREEGVESSDCIMSTDRVSVQDAENVLELNNGDGCTTLRTF